MAGCWQALRAAKPFSLAYVRSLQAVPLGYLAALLLCVLLLWLVLRLALAGWCQGLVFGLQLGAFIGGTGMLGLLSISTAELSLLVGWFISQTVEMGLAGAVAGSGLAGKPLKTILVSVVALVLLLAVVTIAMQSMGLAPAAPTGA